MSDRARLFAFSILVVALGVHTALHLRVGSDITRFLPLGSESDIAVLSSRLADSPITRTLILSIHADDLETAVAAAGELAERLREQPEIDWVRASVDETDLEALFELYFPHRLGFASDSPETELPERLSDGALRARARQLRERLASPASGFYEPLAARDPLGLFEQLAERLRADEPSLRAESGQLVTQDGEYAIVFASVRHSAFDTGRQAPLLEFIRERFDAIATARGAGLDLELAAVGAFSVAAEKAIKGDVQLIAVCSFVGVALLFAAFIGSLRGFLIVSVPPLFGILAATAGGLYLFGELDGMTMAFGASLMGIVIDYSNHLLLHHGLANPAVPPRRMALRLRPSLVLGALTTIASFVGLGLTPFPAFRQMSFFAITGVAAGLLVSLFVLPALIRYTPALPQRSARVAARLGRGFERLAALPRAFLLVPVALGLAATLALPALEWSDDLSRLSRFAPELVAEDTRVRERVTQFDDGRFIIALADDAAAAVAANDHVHARLLPLIEAGTIAGVRSLHTVLWSEALQRRNRSVFESDPGLYERLDAAFVAEGFRPGAFEAFGRELREPAPEPLRYEQLLSGPLAALATPFIFELGDRTAAVTYLRGLVDLAPVRAAVAGLPDVHVLDRMSFVNDIYSEFRRTSLRQIGFGAVLVLVLLALRYRALRPVFAAFLPSVLVAALMFAFFALSGTEANLLHVMSLVMVMGMGVDYGIFCVDSIRHRADFGTTLLGLLVSCLTTALVFGSLAFSSQPSLRAIGLTTGAGVVLSFLLAPVTLAAIAVRSDPAAPDA